MKLILLTFALLFSGCFSTLLEEKGQVTTTDLLPTERENAAYHFEKLKMVNETTGWAMNDQGKIRYTKDGWETSLDITPEQLPAYENIQSFFVLNEKSVWIFYISDKSNQFEEFITNDSGQTWKHQTISSINDPGIADVNFTDEKTGFLFTSFNHEIHGLEPHQLYKTEDGGLSWKVLSPQGLNTSSYKWIHFTNDMSGWSIGENIKKGTDRIDPTTTKLFETQDGGLSWKSHVLIKTINEQGIDYKSPIFFNGSGLLHAVQYPLYDDNGIGKLYTFEYGLKNPNWKLKGVVDFPFKRDDVKQSAFPFFKPENIVIDFVDMNNGWFITNNEMYTTNNGGQSWLKVNDTLSFPSQINIQFLTVNVGFSFHY
ncbi:MAG: hypothetical protein WD469_04260 [Paenibacillaceae bacterium]